MGFLQAICALGELASQEYKDSPLSDIMQYLQLPHPLGEPEDRKAHVIRVWLDVADPRADILDVHGIADIDRIEYAAIGIKEVEIKEKCLYHQPVGSNVNWRFSPLLKLGKAVKDPVNALLGEDWQSDKDARIYKLKRNVLSDYETVGRISKGSVDRIMTGLADRVNRIAELWSDNKRSYLLVFGVNDGGRFLYPGQVPAFVSYFRSKLGVGNSKVVKKGKQELFYCSLCGKQSNQAFALNRILKFSTFDKPNFLPGVKPGKGVPEKVFPVCETCYGFLSAGFEVVEKQFTNSSVIEGINLYVIPEILFDKQNNLPMATEFTQNFIKKGINLEPGLFEYLAGQGEGLVYHFLLIEPNQAQLIIHSLIEDVPPSRLKKLENLWIETCKVFNNIGVDENERHTLDTAISQTVAILYSLAGKSKEDQRVMQEKSMAVVSALLNGNPVRIDGIKALMVSRFPGLFSDPDWISPKGKGGMPGRLRLRRMAEIVDFLQRANRRWIV